MSDAVAKHLSACRQDVARIVGGEKMSETKNCIEKTMTEVRVSYDFAAYPALDAVAHAAAGRESDFSGTAVRAGWRELGWICCDELSAARMVRSLKAVGLNPKSVTVDEARNGK